MQVTKNITLDLLETGSPVIIKAKQNDRNTRYIAAHLYVGRLDYPVPSGTEIAFRYKKPDGTAGFYDALPDNSQAITVSGNTVTVELVEQVLTAAGCVHCEINMYNAASEKLTTFTFEISVEESVLTDAEIISSDYYNLLTSEIAKALQAVTDATEQAENAAQSAQEAADSAAMSKDWAAGQPVTYSGAPVSIAYAGAQRIASITAYGETPQGGTTEAPVALTGISSVTVNDDVTELPIPRPLRRVGDVKDKCVTRQDYESAEKLVVTYNVGFVELDGTEDVTFHDYGNGKRLFLDLSRSAFGQYSLEFSHGEVVETPTIAGGLAASFNASALYRLQIIGIHDTWTALGVTDTATAKTWLAAQKAAGTPVQIAYHLATPEVYATDPVDFDNTAGPLTVMTGGKLEVRMTELVGSRSPEIVAKMDKTVYAQVGNPSELDNDNFLHCVNQRNVSGTISTSGYFIDRWKLISGTVQITENGLVLNGTISQILENAAGTDVTASSSAGAASYDNSTKTFTLTATGQTITWAKLEKGSVATPYVPKGYGAELAECLRYFQRVHADWRIYPTLKDMLYRFSQSTLQVMRIKPTISAHGTPYTFGCTINALDAQPMAFTVETKITEQGQNAAVASMLGYFDLSADL